MANCHSLFQEFYRAISLSSSKRDNLKVGRDALRQRIKTYFSDELSEKVPGFLIQGSYAMDTIVNPLEGEYDIDDGVYLQNIDSDKEKWPTPETVHQWIYKAVEGHTDEKPQNKKTCIRVVYSKNYHVDLPIYGIYENDAYLAEMSDNGWHVSEPRLIIKWFREQIKSKTNQLRRILRYAKAWVDYQSGPGKLPSGFVLTVLLAENYEKSERDDSSFAGSMKNIQERILSSPIILNPVDTDEDLGKRITESQMKFFKSKLQSLIANASIALKDDDKVEACKIWKSEFGQRYPKCEDLEKDDVPLKTSRPAILRDDARSA